MLVERDIIHKVVIRPEDRDDNIVLESVDDVSISSTELHIQQYGCLRTTVHLCDVYYALLYRGCGVVVIHPNKKYTATNTTYFENDKDLEYKIEKFIKGVSI